MGRSAAIPWSRAEAAPQKVGLVFSLEPLIPALILCALAGRLLALFSERPAGAPGAMGFLMVLAIALAFLVLSISGVHANAAFELLWGSLLAVRPVEVLLLGKVGNVISIQEQYRPERHIER